MNYKTIGSTASAVVLLATLVALCFFVGQGPEVRALNFAVLVFGAACGWLTGVLVSPYDPKEATAFPQYAGAISAYPPSPRVISSPRPIGYSSRSSILRHFSHPLRPSAFSWPSQPSRLRY